MADEKYTPIFNQDIAKKIVVAVNEGNELADTEFSHDIQTAPWAILRDKYGEDVANSRRLYSEERVDQYRIKHGTQSVPQFIGDSVVGVTAGAAGVIGSVAAAAVGLTPGGGKLGVAIAEKSDFFNEAIMSFQSKELQERKGLSGVEASLDAEDNLAQYDRDTNDGANASFMDDLQWFGRGTLNNGGRILKDSAVATDVVMQAVGSLGPSAKLASVASKLVTGTRTFKAAQLAHAISPTTSSAWLVQGANAVNRSAIAAGVGASEASGAYTDTVNRILDMTHGQLMEGSAQYAAMVEQGIDPDDAKVEIAANSGKEAFGKQFPAAMALGLLAAKFEAAPMANFKGTGFIGGLRTVGAQALEEGGQGASAQISANSAIRNNADSSQGLMEGVPEQFAVGALAGAGMAGLMASPSALRASPATIKEVATSEPVKIVSKVVASGVVGTAKAAAVGVGKAASVAGTAVKAAADTKAGAAVTTKTKVVSKKAAKIVAPVIVKTAAKVVDTIQDVNQRPNPKLQEASLTAVQSIETLSETYKDKPAVKVISGETSSAAVPETFKANVPKGGTVIQNITGVMNKMAEKGFKIHRMDDGDALYAAAQFEALKGSASSLPVQMRNQVKKVLSSQTYAKVQARVAKIDLNRTQLPTQTVNTGSVAETVAVAKTNPVNVNPVVVDKILKQDDRSDLTEEDIKILETARDVALAINTHIGDSIDIKKAENVELELKATQGKGSPTLVKVPEIESVSRDIAVGSELKDGKGKGLRSIGDFARQILEGGQSTNGTYTSVDGISVKVEESVHVFNMFTQHMINKVAALNTSYDNNNSNGKGTPERFRSLSQGRQMVNKDSAAAGAAMTYHKSSPGSVAFAKQVRADAVAAVAVYNTLAKAFPKHFAEIEMFVPELRGFETVQEAVENIEPETTEETAPLEDVPFEDREVISDPQVTDESTNPTVVEYQKRFEGKDLKIVVTKESSGMIASYSKNSNTISINLAMARTDFEAGLVYIDGEGGFTSAQKAEVFKDIEVRSFKQFIKSSGFNTYVKFILEHELQHVRQNSRGENYPRDSNGKPDLMSPEAIRLERDANQAGYTAIGYSSSESLSQDDFDKQMDEQRQAEDVTEQAVEKPTLNSTTFEDNFITTDEGVPYKNGQEILDLVSEDATEGYLEFVSLLLQPLMDEANNRLKSFKINSKDELSIFERNLAGEDTSKFRQYMNTVFVGSDGKYDADLLSIAAVAVLDWATSVRAGNPSQMRDKMDDAGVEYTQLTQDNIHDMMYGVPPRDAAESIARDVVRMWGTRISKDVPMIEGRGAVEGLVKELLTSLTKVSYVEPSSGELETPNLIELKKVPYFDKDSGRIVEQFTFNVQPMLEVQRNIGTAGQGSVQKALAPELNTMPSFNEKHIHVDKTQSRGDVQLSDMERKALKTMQDTPHRIADNLTNMVKSIGYDVMSTFLGSTPIEGVDPKHPLAASIAGKNLSIERDYNEAMQIVDGIVNEEGDVEVYYKVGVSRVGRHQFKGINPQNNKILRAMVTPTHADLDMTTKQHRDNFWLTVSQGSGISKVENENHRQILSTIQENFYAEFGDAVDAVEVFLGTGEMDTKALMSGFKNGQGDMQQLATVFAVAEYNMARHAGTESSFKTTLSFELDGKTDGPGNMMVNFGQGLLTASDWNNFQRVGLFLGTKLKTLNKFYGDGSKKGDLYVVTALSAQKAMYEMLSKATGLDHTRLDALVRFSVAFGDFEIDPNTGETVMTRTTAKNPMTKTVYGSSENGVGSGLASDMEVEFYNKILNDPQIMTKYPELKQDYETLFGVKFPTNRDWGKEWNSKDSSQEFKKVVTETLGRILSETAKSTVGPRITHVNDALVMATSFQTEFLQLKFKELLTQMVDAKIADGTMHTLKSGKPNMTSMHQRDYDQVVAELKRYSPVYANGMQTLDIGAFSPTDSGIALSSAMDGTLSMDSSMISPELAGVKAVPYVTIGRGDAMMMNRIYSGDFPPAGTLNVFDGIDVAIDKIQEYATPINEAVANNWDADVLGDIVNDFSGFMGKVSTDTDLINLAWARAQANAEKKGSDPFTPLPADLEALLISMRDNNRARKRVFKRIGISVDHMGGSGIAYIRGSNQELTFAEINIMIADELIMIADELAGITAQVPSEVETNELVPEVEVKREPKKEEFSRLVVSDAQTTLQALYKETKKKHVKATVSILLKSSFNSKVIVGTMDEILNWYKKNVGNIDEAGLKNTNGMYVPSTNTILIGKNSHETMTHELIHAATFQKVLEVYESGVADDTVTRLEVLMDQFMGMQFKGKRVIAASQKAKAQIIAAQANTDAFSKATALNEFMAWTLSNESIMKELKTTPVPTITKLYKTVKALMSRLIGGVPSNMFDSILFNTAVLIEGNQEDLGVSGSGNGDGGNNNNKSGEVTPTAENHTNYWIEALRTRLTNIGNNQNQTQIDNVTEYRDNAKSALEDLSRGGFSLSAYQQETFKAIHTVMAMEMRLKTGSSIALNEMFQHVLNSLTPAMFGPKNMDERYSTVMELFGKSKNVEGVSDGIAVLLALSQTSKGFRKALDQLVIPTSGAVSTESMNDFLSTITNNVMSKAVGSIDISKGSALEIMDKMSEAILLEDSEKEFRILNGLSNSITKTDDFLAGGFRLLAGMTNKVNEKAKADKRSLVVRLATGSVAAATALLDPQRAQVLGEGALETVTSGGMFDNKVAIREMVTEMVGTTESSKTLVAMLDEVSFNQSTIRQGLREDVPQLFVDEFVNTPDAAEWKAAHHVLGKTDFAAVFSNDQANTSFRLISDEAFLDKKIAQTEAVIIANMSSLAAVDVMDKGMQLAGYMNGEGAGNQLLKNANLINKLSGGYVPSMTGQIDKLISYYAIKGSDAEQRIAITEMYKGDPEAMKTLVSYIQSLNRTEDAKITTGAARLNGLKGYIPNEGTQGSKIVIANDSTQSKLEKSGFTRVGDAPADSDFSLISRGYYVTTTKQTGTYSQGVMQTVQDSYRGVNSTTGLSVDGRTSGIIAGDAVSTITTELETKPNLNSKEALIPVFSIEDNGDIVVEYYERAINPDLLEMHTTPESNLAVMIGSWAGRQQEEKDAQQYNESLVLELKKIYEDTGPNQKGMFVDLPAEAKRLKAYDKATKEQQKTMRKPDRIYVDSWNAISPETKTMIKEINGGKEEFFIRKDQMNLALGYRDPSIIDMWTGNTRVPEALQESVQALSASIMGDKAMSMLSYTEEAVQGVISTAKDLIVVRSLIVPYMNTQANVFQLQTNGVAVKKMWKAYPEKLAEIEQWNKNSKAINKLNMQIEAAGLDVNRVSILNQTKDGIESQNKRFSIAPLIEAGAYKNISEGLDLVDVDITSGRIGDWVQSQTDKLPAGIQTVAKYGLLSKDTALYQGANKAVQYGDFIAKAIYYDHLLSEKKLSHDEAMRLVNEEFVNFSVLPGRTRTLMEGYGATWFLTFKIRIMKIAMRQIREHPARALITGMTVGSLGSPVADNLATVIAEDRIGYSLGYEMLFGSAELNPWMNIIDWD